VPLHRRSAPDERERSAQLEQDLAAARRDVETQTALATKAGEETFRLKAAGESGAAELQKSLQQERERSARLEQDLAAARRDVESQTALATKAGEETSRLRQVRESDAAGLHKSLKQEGERSARLEQDLAAMRRDVESQTALATKAGEETSRLKAAGESGAAELQKSLKQEGERSARLERDLATARRDLETNVALATKASEEAARARETAERDSAALRNSLQQERARTERLERDIALAQGTSLNVATIGSTTRDKSNEVATNPIAERAPAALARGDAQPNSEQAAVAAGLVGRASALLRQGDIGAARLVLERAVEMGSAQASFALAETYDPLVLAKWGTYGTRGDARKAQDLYARADAAGLQEAKTRLEALRR
jgi:septal ring factor EnvC (AmiA/AmiB activator)